MAGFSPLIMKALVFILSLALWIGALLLLASCANKDAPATATPAATAPETTRMPPAPPAGVARPMGTRGGG